MAHIIHHTLHTDTNVLGALKIKKNITAMHVMLFASVHAMLALNEPTTLYCYITFNIGCSQIQIEGSPFERIFVAMTLI